ncbi:MAG: SDR family oxidoreductase [Mesorhizobium sp.]|uniref:SDR family oxidoreductase n=1 Tax=Mesorhizobium sp. TaxID=1871066 RepID=UPI000FE6ED55|nr:SDR family oxidoreductase [Mesorhizobium sp.]RWD50769.1 MAG: SDR family oxidoreductase [Mesorhizobium sp.]RWE58664.1 MAG: SDR family oxidoreductase [Mesorhizobium sp.]RWF09065.1 MAG: SDR family oxidoreductase [Mesorhizobium sp.]RWF22325.1 MAG: SDR family oxidoreductase [Mesorhizobium sp.]TIY07097.1 MAG: SDR family oxidoreductase [Mesorhizobium sp.]
MNKNTRRVLVTAASKGLGFAIANRMAKDGAQVVICGRNQLELDKSVAKLLGNARCEVAHGIVADLSRRSDVDNLFDRTLNLLGGVDCLVVNSGHAPYGTIDTLSDDDWGESYEMLLLSAVRLSRAAAKVMKASDRGGDIVYVTSAGIHEATDHRVASNVMRAGIAVVAKHLADILSESGVRVNVVAPGYFDTGRVRKRIEDLMVDEGLNRQAATARIATANPLGRIGAANELAELIAFIVGDRARYLNGTTITMDGGSSRLVT